MPMTLSTDEKKLWRHNDQLPKCLHRDSRVVAVVSASGAQGRREQCAGCGKVDTVVLPVALHRDCPAVDVYAAQRWRDQEQAAKDASADLAKKRWAMRQAAKPAETEEWFAKYSEDLRGDAWQTQRLFVLRRDNGRCQAHLPGCTGFATQVHHREGGFAYRYHELLGVPPAFVLASVCETCHDKITAADRRIAGRS